MTVPFSESEKTIDLKNLGLKSMLSASESQSIPVTFRYFNIMLEKGSDIIFLGDLKLDKSKLGGVFKNRFGKTAQEQMLERIDFDPSIFEKLHIPGDLSRRHVKGEAAMPLKSLMVQISQPRQPCWKLSRRWELPKLAVRVQQTRRTGWYLRVLQEGTVFAQEAMRLIDRPHPEWTIAEANEVMFATVRNAQRDLALSKCSSLSSSWKKTLAMRASKRHFR